MNVDFKEYSKKMDRTLVHLAEEFDAVRAGRANPKVLDRITVEYYGQATPLNGVATISTPDARTLVVQPWDTQLLKEIQKPPTKDTFIARRNRRIRNPSVSFMLSTPRNRCWRNS